MEGAKIAGPESFGCGESFQRCARAVEFPIEVCGQPLRNLHNALFDLTSLRLSHAGKSKNRQPEHRNGECQRE
jgi:hypothetical protein